MALTLRPTGLKSRADHDKLPDWSVMSGGFVVGRIYKVHGATQPNCQWLWSINGIHMTGVARANGHTATLDIAKAELKHGWEAWLSWAKLDTGEPLAFVLDPDPPVNAGYPEFRVSHGPLRVGRISHMQRRFELPGGWFWTISGVHGPPEAMRIVDHVANRELATTQLTENWQKWLAWAKL